MSNREPELSYGRPAIALGYDVLSRFVFAPVGGLEALREHALDHFGIGPGVRVLELGCGTGGVTERLLARGAVVTAVDWSEPMLRRARRRAPAATFVRSELTAYQPREKHDVALFAFVLHELERGDRRLALGVAARALRQGRGRLAIVDHELPRRGVVPRLMAGIVHGFEPGTATDWLVGMDGEVRAAGFVPQPHVTLAGGLATAFVATPGLEPDDVERLRGLRE